MRYLPRTAGLPSPLRGGAGGGVAQVWTNCRFDQTERLGPIPDHVRITKPDDVEPTGSQETVPLGIALSTPGKIVRGSVDLDHDPGGKPREVDHIRPDWRLSAKTRSKGT